MSTLWTRLPVSMLTIRQFSGGRTVRLAVLLSCIPALFAALFVFRPWESSADGYLTDLFRELIVPTLLPMPTKASPAMLPQAATLTTKDDSRGMARRSAQMN